MRCASLIHWVCLIQYLLYNIFTVHDTENLTFSEEFRSCSAQASADSCAIWRGSSTQAGADLLRGWTRIFHADSGWKWRKPEGKLQCWRIEKDITRIVRIMRSGVLLDFSYTTVAHNFGIVGFLQTPTPRTLCFRLQWLRFWLPTSSPLM